jgi:Fe-S oxidoreductase
MFGDTETVFEVESVEDFIEKNGGFLKAFAEELAAKLEMPYKFTYESVVYEFLCGLLVTVCPANEDILVEEQQVS